MIHKFLLSVSCVLCFFLTSHSQHSSKSVDDAIVRAAFASEYIEEANYTYDTPAGEAGAVIILKAYREFLPIPEVSSLSIIGSDKIKIEQLITKLNQLRINPPSWEEIINFEKEKIIQHDKAVNRSSKYKNK